MAGRGPFGKIRHKGTCDCECAKSCADCSDTFPESVSVLIPALGVSDTALLTFSEDDAFLYQWEGSDGNYSWQADFACANINFVIANAGLTYVCTADNGPPTTVTIRIVSCFPDTLQIIYTFDCLEGGSLEVVLMG